MNQKPNVKIKEDENLIEIEKNRLMNLHVNNIDR